MSKTPPRTVKETGALPDDILVGITPRNLGLAIRVHNTQERGFGGRIAGAFDILHWGTGTYSQDIMAVYRAAESFGSVEMFITVLKNLNSESDFSHGLNANGLWKLDASVIVEEVISATTDEGASDSEFADDMAIAERVMREDREVLRRLADS